MIIEQSLIKSIKSSGGISRGHSTTDSLLCKWVCNMHTSNIISEEIEKFFNISSNSSEYIILFPKQNR